MTLKRFVDFVFAVILIVPALAVSLILMAIIRLETPGEPMIFQQRVGRDERLFKCLKLRTFVVGTEVVATHEAQSNQITKVGRIIRPLHLDELPQVWNVLIGDMSFVGPRPCLPFMADVIEARRALRIEHLRPGITGIAQLEGVDMRTPELLARLDAVTLQRGSIFFDFRIAIATIIPALWQRWRKDYIVAKQN